MSKLKNYFKKLVERNIIIDNIAIALDEMEDLNRKLRKNILIIDKDNTYIIDTSIDIDSIKIIDDNINFLRDELNVKSKKENKLSQKFCNFSLKYLCEDELIEYTLDILDKMEDLKDKVRHFLTLIDKYDTIIDCFVDDIENNIDCLKRRVKQKSKENKKIEKDIKKDFELKHTTIYYGDLEDLGIKASIDHYYYDADNKLHIRCFDELTNILLEYFNEKIKNIENEINELKKKTKSQKIKKSKNYYANKRK